VTDSQLVIFRAARGHVVAKEPVVMAQVKAAIEENGVRPDII
jgi:hypothetical protein